MLYTDCNLVSLCFEGSDKPKKLWENYG